MRRRSWQVHNEVFSRCNGFITCIVPTTRHTREQDTRTIRGHTPNPRSPTHTHATEIDSGWPFSYLRHINQSRTSHTTYVRKQQAEVHDHSTSMEEWLGNYQLTQELTTIERPEPRYRGFRWRYVVGPCPPTCSSSEKSPKDLRPLPHPCGPLVVAFTSVLDRSLSALGDARRVEGVP